MICSKCQQEFNYFKIDSSKKRNGSNDFPCPHCGATVRLDRAFKQRIKMLGAFFTALAITANYFVGKLGLSTNFSAVFFPLVFCGFVFMIYLASKTAKAEAVSSESVPLPYAKLDNNNASATEIKADGFVVKLEQSPNPALKQEHVAAYGLLRAVAITLVLALVVVAKIFKIMRSSGATKPSPLIIAVVLVLSCAWLGVSAYMGKRWGAKKSLIVSLGFAAIIFVAGEAIYKSTLKQQYVNEFNGLATEAGKQVDLQDNSGVVQRKITAANSGKDDYLKFVQDKDADGLLDKDEKDNYKTDPSSVDTDGDGLTDYEEIMIYKSDPLKTDTDSDGRTDGAEAVAGYSPAGEGKFDPFATPEVALYYMEHLFAKGDFEGYESVFDYSDSFVNNFIRTEFNTDLEGFKRRFKNKVFLKAKKDNVGAVVVYKTQLIDDDNVGIEYYRFLIRDGIRGRGELDKTYFTKHDGRWLVNLEKELTESKASDSERWRATKSAYSQE
ncbi:TIGR04086 family membrane protein [Candidatus Falkowbacteria bacterium]|nr:TIGR04086 family membrane protein [Candidatus Falkowbacteria bacterium]